MSISSPLPVWSVISGGASLLPSRFLLPDLICRLPVFLLSLQRYFINQLFSNEDGLSGRQWGSRKAPSSEDLYPFTPFPSGPHRSSRHQR